MKKIFALFFMTFCVAWVAQAQNTALAFDGVDDYVESISWPYINVFKDNIFTFEIIYENSQNGNAQVFLSQQNSVGQLAIGLNNENNPYIKYYDEFIVFEEVFLESDQCIHLSMTGSRNSLKLYINGTLMQSTVNSLPHGLFSENHPFYIGKDIANNSHHFFGVIDEVRLFTDERSSAEIQSKLFKEIDAKEDNKFFQYTCYELTADKIFDPYYGHTIGYLGGLSTNANAVPSWTMAACCHLPEIPESVDINCQPLPACVPSQNPNEQLCNGNFEQFCNLLYGPQPVWALPEHAFQHTGLALGNYPNQNVSPAGSDVNSWLPNQNGWTGAMMNTPDFYVRNGLGALNGFPPTMPIIYQIPTSVYFVSPPQDTWNNQGDGIAGLGWNEGISTKLKQPLKSNQSYTFSGWFYNTNTYCDIYSPYSPCPALNIPVQVKVTSNQVGTGLAYHIPATINIQNNQLNTGNNGWQYVTITFTTGVISTNLEWLNIENDGIGSGQYLFIDDVSLIELCGQQNWPQQITHEADQNGNTNHHYTRHIETDAAGNTYIAVETNYTAGAGIRTANYGPGSFATSQYNSIGAILVAKYNDCGDLMWNEHINVTDNDIFLAGMEVSSTGDVYIAGSHDGLFGQTLATSSGSCSVGVGGSGNFMAKLNTQGQCQWLVPSVSMNDIVLNESNNEIYALGNGISKYININTLTPNNSGPVPVPNLIKVTRGAILGNNLYVLKEGVYGANNTALYIHKYDINNLSFGPIASSAAMIDDKANNNSNWISGSAYERIEDLNIDSQGNVYIAGNTNASLSFNGTPSSTSASDVMVVDFYNLNGNKPRCGFIAKYNSNLVFQKYAMLKPPVAMQSNPVNTLNSLTSSCTPPAGPCDVVVTVPNSAACSGGTEYLCYDYTTTYQNVHTMNSTTGISSLLHEMTFDDNDNILLSGLAEYVEIDNSIIQVNGLQALTCKFDNNLNEVWGNATDGDAGINNFVWWRTTGIAKHKDAGQFRVIGNFYGSAKLFDNSTLSNSSNLDYVFITNLTDNGQTSIFKNKPDENETALIEEQDVAWKIYPNPAQTLLKIEGDACEYQMFNTLGQPLIQGIATTNGTSVIELSGLPSGVYLLRIKGRNGKIENHRVVKH